MHTGHQDQPSSVGHSQALDQPFSRDPGQEDRFDSSMDVGGGWGGAISNLV